MAQFRPLAIRAHKYALSLERQMRPSPAYFAFTMMFNWYATHVSFC